MFALCAVCVWGGGDCVDVYRSICVPGCRLYMWCRRCGSYTPLDWPACWAESAVVDQCPWGPALVIVRSRREEVQVQRACLYFDSACFSCSESLLIPSGLMLSVTLNPHVYTARLVPSPVIKQASLQRSRSLLQSVNSTAYV